MDVNALTTAIGSFGFPIVACILMFYIYNRTVEEHAAESKAFTAAINELRIAIVELKDKLNHD